MKISVIYTTQVKAALGIAGEEVELPDGATLGDLLARLAEMHGEPFEQMVLDSAGGLLPSILLCIDDEQVPGDRTEPLKPGETVTILSAISGG